MTLPFAFGAFGGKIEIAAPTIWSVSVIGTAPSKTLRVQWTDNSDNETDWEIQRRETSGGVWSTVHTMTTANEGATGGNETWDDTDAGKLYDTLYEYRVRATRPGGSSDYSAVMGQYTDAQAPDAPAWFTGYPQDDTTDDDSILLRLSGSPDATAFQVYAKVGSSMSGSPTSNGQLLAGGNLTPAEIREAVFDHDAQTPAVSQGDTVYYQARALTVGSNGRTVFGSFGVEASATAHPRVPGVPAAPTVALQSGPQVFVDWAAGNPDTATAYRLKRQYRDIGSTGAWTEEVLPGTVTAPTTEYTDTTVVEGQEYQYAVQAENSAGTNGYSAWSTTVEVCVQPGQVTGVSTTATGVADPETQRRVSWNTPSGTISTYRIRWRLQGSADPWSEATDPSSPYDITGLAPGTDYEVQVRAESPSCGDGTYSTLVTFTTEGGVPGLPTITSWAPIQATDDQLRLAFTQATDATSHDVEWAQSVSQPASGTVVTGVTSPWDLTGRPANTSHWVRVRGVNGTGNGDWTSWVQAYTHLQSPASFSGTLDDTQCPGYKMDLSWSNTNSGSNTRSEQMTIERSENGGSSWTTVTTTVTAGATTYSDTSGTAGSTNRYRIKYNGESTWTEVAVNSVCPT